MRKRSKGEANRVAKNSKAHRTSGVALCTTAEGKPKRPVRRVFGFEQNLPMKETMPSEPLSNYQAMDRQELVRLAGEQALLKKETNELTAAQQRDTLALRNVANSIGHNTNWHARGIELLNQLKEREAQIALSYHRLNELSKLTGIN